MIYKRNGSTIAVRLDPGDEICGAITYLAKKENIGCAFVTGIGATDDFTVGVFDLEKREYKDYSFSGNHEITNLTGNITTMNGKEYVHLHINCAGVNGSIVGGHLKRAVISLTAEIFVTAADIKTDRVRNEELGINQTVFPE